MTSRDTIPFVPLGAPDQPAQGVRISEIKTAGLSHEVPFSASLFSVDVDCESAIESHAVKEMWVVLRGAGQLRYDGRTSEVTAGDVVYFEPHKTHMVNNGGTEPLLVLAVWWP